MDKRKKYIMVLDTETANGIVTNDKLDLSDSLVYDIGFVVIDKKGKIYEKKSIAIRELFCDMADVMQSAYYADKLPEYWNDIKTGERLFVDFMTARRIIRNTMDKYNINVVAAHNARFDVMALNNTIRYITKSGCRYFFPYGTEIWDTYKGAMKTLCKHKGYIQFCQREGYMTKHKTPRVRATAEILYKYLTGDYNFTEKHQGLDDCLIESKILVQILRQHRKMEYIRLYA